MTNSKHLLSSCLDKAKKRRIFLDLQAAERSFSGVSVKMMPQLFTSVELLPALTALIHLVNCAS